MALIAPLICGVTGYWSGRSMSISRPCGVGDAEGDLRAGAAFDFCKEGGEGAGRPRARARWMRMVVRAGLRRRRRRWGRWPWARSLRVSPSSSALTVRTTLRAGVEVVAGGFEDFGKAGDLVKAGRVGKLDKGKAVAAGGLALLA